jgi:hypothetical protein
LVPDSALQELRQMREMCETAEALDWLYPNGEGFGELTERVVLNGPCEAVVRWALKWGYLDKLDRESELFRQRLVERCMHRLDLCRWVLRARPEFKEVLTANILLFAESETRIPRLECVRVLREFGYDVTEAMKRRCIQENSCERICALLSCGFLSSVPPRLDRMSCRDRWLLWTPVTHGLIKDFEVTQRVITALCCFRVYCPRLPKDLKGLILTMAMES